MKAVLISIRPQWCEKIASGEKTIEVRKTAPKEVPFKAYIYETKESKMRYLNDRFNSFLNNKSHYTDMGKVIGEFICDKVSTYPRNYEFGYEISENEFNETALTAEQFVDYGNGGTLYGWHISDLKIYDKPKELSEFYTIAESGSDCCCGCVWHETPLFEMPCRTCTGERKYLYRPPQSWCYVEER